MTDEQPQAKLVRKPYRYQCNVNDDDHEVYLDKLRLKIPEFADAQSQCENLRNALVAMIAMYDAVFGCPNPADGPFNEKGHAESGCWVCKTMIRARRVAKTT